MKSISIKLFIVLIAISAAFTSCKKADSPEPSTQALLVSNKWLASAETNLFTGASTPIAPNDCKSAFVIELTSTGLIYTGDLCNGTSLYSGYTISDNIVSMIGGEQFQVVEISPTAMKINMLKGGIPVIQYSMSAL